MKRFSKWVLVAFTLMVLSSALPQYANTVKTYGEGLLELGLIAGGNDGLKETDFLTREEMIVILNRLSMDKSAYKAFQAPETPTFADVPKTHWAFRDIEFAVQQGVTSGVSKNTFGTGMNITANQAAQFLINSLALQSSLSFNDAYASIQRNYAFKPEQPALGKDALMRTNIYEMIAWAIQEASAEGGKRIDYLTSDTDKIQTFLKSTFTTVHVTLYDTLKTTLVDPVSSDLSTMNAFMKLDAYTGATQKTKSSYNNIYDALKNNHSKQVTYYETYIRNAQFIMADPTLLLSAPLSLNGTFNRFQYSSSLGDQYDFGNVQIVLEMQNNVYQMRVIRNAKSTTYTLEKFYSQSQASDKTLYLITAYQDANAPRYFVSFVMKNNAVIDLLVVDKYTYYIYQ